MCPARPLWGATHAHVLSTLRETRVYTTIKQRFAPTREKLNMKQTFKHSKKTSGLQEHTSAFKKYHTHLGIVRTSCKFSNWFSNKSHISDHCLLVADSKSAFPLNPLWQNVTNYCCSLSPYHSNPLSLLSVPLHPLHPHCLTTGKGLSTDHHTHTQLQSAVCVSLGGLSCVVTFYIWGS